MSDDVLTTATAVNSRMRLSPAMRIMFSIGERFETGRICWILPDGSSRITGKKRFLSEETEGVDVTVQLNGNRIARRLLFGGNTGIGIAYVEGDYEPDNLPLFLTICATNMEALDKTLRGSWLYRSASRVFHWLNQNTETGSKRNILYHYDLGNDFYERWLDPTMTYSSAEFANPSESLIEGQQNKYENLAQRLEANDNHHLLEIGCGWGGFAEHVAKTRGCKVTALTISDAQHDYAAARMQREGLNEKVSIVKRDYRHETGQYDGIASIEMFEAVGEKYWPVFFGNLHDRLHDHAKAALQIITIGDEHFEGYRTRPDFIQAHIFPGGMLPSPTALRGQVDQAGLKIENYENFGQSYARTLSEWNDKFQQTWHDIARLPTKGQKFDTRFKRMWEYYLSYCEAGFRAQTIDVCRVTLSKS